MRVALAALLFLFATQAGAECRCLKCLTGLWHIFYVPQGGMKPALEPEACVTIKRGERFDRGSIIVFRHPVTPEYIMIWRLIGLPGDVIEMKGGKLFLNGSEVPQRSAAPYPQTMQPEGKAAIRPRCPTPTEDGQVCLIPRFTETLPNGASYDVLDLDPRSAADDAGPFSVPPGHVFALGDNRDDSVDSRFAPDQGGHGFIPVANILGPVVEITNP